MIENFKRILKKKIEEIREFKYSFCDYNRVFLLIILYQICFKFLFAIKNNLFKKNKIKLNCILLIRIEMYNTENFLFLFILF